MDHMECADVVEVRFPHSVVHEHKQIRISTYAGDLYVIEMTRYDGSSANASVHWRANFARQWREDGYSPTNHDGTLVPIASGYASSMEIGLARALWDCSNYDETGNVEYNPTIIANQKLVVAALGGIVL